MVTLEFFDPNPTQPGEVTPHAPRLGTLDGKKIGFLSIDEWQAYRTFPLLQDLLRERFPHVRLVPLDAFPKGIGPISTEETAAIVGASGVDAVVIGNAA
jgi:hypothetical protein